MISERRPFEVLNENKPFGLKRVQPSRAAKTSHKWLSSRNEKGKCGNRKKDCCSSLGCLYFDGDENDKENCVEEKSNNASVGRNNFFKHDVKSKSEQLCTKELSRRLPLQALSVPSIKPALLHNRGRNVSVESSGFSYFPPIQTSPDDTMSISMETISETSFSGDLEDNFGTDSAFFSSTQSSLPSMSSQNEMKSEARPNVCRPLIIPGRNIDVLDEYIPDILAYMREAEEKYRPRPDFMQRQPEITATMRTKLVDWLIEVQDEYKLENETVSLAVVYVDRFLSHMSVTRSKLQLLGTTAMFVAAKYEEIYPPDSDEFAYVTADTYTKQEVILMERLLLRALGTNLAVPTPNQFLGFLFHKSSTTYRFRALATYLVEITTLHDDFYQYSYSVLAASAIAVANFLLGSRNDDVDKDCKGLDDSKLKVCELSPFIRDYMQNYHSEIYSCSLDLSTNHRNISNASQHFVKEKYSSKKHHKVALIPFSDFLTPSTPREAVLSVWM